MKFNESLLKSKIKENLKGVKNDLDREGKATAIAEALNFFDSKRDWVTKINRDEIISLITNSPSQDVLCESIIDKVNATPFSKSLKESKKKKESKKLNEGLSKKPLREGPGAGYTIKGAISDLSDIKVIDVKEGKNDYNEDIVTVKATANCRINDVSASSYYYGRAIVDGAEIPATFEINFTYYAGDFSGESPEQVVKYYNDFVFECGLGGGWSHVTFDGVIEGDYNDVKDDPYGCDTNTFKITITNENVIRDIDNAVTGDDWFDQYDVIDIDGDVVDSFDNEEDAIAYAKKNRYVAVEHNQYQYALLDDFESEDIIYEYNEGTVWERDYEKQYKFDDDDTNEGLKEAKDDLQTKATKMMSVKKYYIDMAWKNGKTWKTDPMTLDEIAKSVDTDKVTEQQFVNMMSNNIKGRKDAKNLTKAEIVKLYDYMNGKWQSKDVLWSLKGKTNESLDDTQKLIDNAKKFAKENNKDVKVKGLVNSNECVIDTFPEDFNEMVKLFNTKFDVYDKDSELERFKIKAKSTNENLNEEVYGKAKEFINELKEFKQFQIDRIKQQNGYDYDDVDIDVGGQDYDGCVDELLDIAQFYDREFDNLTHTIEAKVKDCVEQNMSIFEIVDYLIRDCKSEFNESIKEHISSKDLKDNDILDILGIEEEQRKVKNVGSYIKQYRQLLDKGYDEPKFEIYLKGDDAYYKKLGKVVDNSKDLVVIDTNSKDESLKEGYYDYMDKDYADILDKDVDVYDIKQFVLNDTNNEFRTHYSDEFALITCPNGKGCVVDYEAVGQDFDSLDSEIEFGIEENKDSEYTDENGTTHKTIRIFASHILTTTPKEVMEKAPKKTMKYRDFFRKYKYNDRCANNFSELVSYIKKNGGLQESCHSKKKRTLKEGYLGQTLEDFFYDCVDPEVIGTVSLWGDDDEIYNGDYEGAIDEYGSNEFIEFDCGMDKVVINVDTSEEYQVTDYFIDVQDFVDCFNGDDIEVYDIHTGETLFSGDRYELPDDVAEKIFVSFDAPKFISINVEEDGDRFDDDDDFDESLKEDWVKHFKNFDYYPNEDENKFIIIKTDGNGKTLDKFEIDVTTYEDAKKYIKDNLLEKVVNEDTVKQGGKWVNKGNTGETHGEFKTKKEADKQRKAMFVNKKPNAKWGK